MGIGKYSGENTMDKSRYPKDMTISYIIGIKGSLGEIIHISENDGGIIHDHI